MKNQKETKIFLFSVIKNKLIIFLMKKNKKRKRKKIKKK